MVSKNGAIAVLVAALLLATGALAATVVLQEPTSSARAQQGASPTACDYTAVYDRVNGAVVSISTDAGAGSGFVYDASDDGRSHVVTNAHVVGEAPTVTVQFSREETREGTVVGRDRLTDLAVVAVPDTPDYVDPLDVASSLPAHGQPVAALGNPFGLEETMTHGIVSGLNRSMPTQFGFAVPATVQTDAAISPGNSGGPLVTCNGSVVGVNSAGIASPQAENIGFAVSATIVQAVVPSLVEDGEYAHPYLGVRVVPVGPAEAQANGLAEPRGLLVRSTQQGTPAADALRGATGTTVVNGQRVPVGGDVVVAINGTPVDSPEALSSTLITQTEPGSSVPVTVVRDGEEVTVDVAVAERPDPTAPSSGR